MKNRVTAVLTAVLMMFVFLPVQAAEGVITSFYVDSTGRVEIIGYCDDTEQKDTTLLMTSTELTEEMTSDELLDKIMYIDQREKGNNGTFYFHFPLTEKWSKSKYILKMNGGTMIEQSGILREIPSGIENVSNNAVRIGNDIYDVGCAAYTPDNIAQSLAEGGNKIYYKIGGEWFDMLNEDATSTAYFKMENSVPQAVWDTWEIGTYYHY